MRPSQSEVRREYKSRRVIYSSMLRLQQRAAVARMHAREQKRQKRGKSEKEPGRRIDTRRAHGCSVDRRASSSCSCSSASLPSFVPLRSSLFLSPSSSSPSSPSSSFSSLFTLFSLALFLLPIHRHLHHHHYREHNYPPSLPTPPNHKDTVVKSSAPRRCSPCAYTRATRVKTHTSITP